MQFRVKRLEHHEEVPLVDHLDELRNRMIVSILALAAAFAVAFWRHQDLIKLLERPLPKGHKLAVFDVTEQFRIALQVSFWAAVLVALPVLFYQVYAFVIPAFKEDRERTTWPYLIVVCGLFLGGVVFAYYLVLPPATSFLLNFDSGLYEVNVKAGSYFSFASTLMLGMGIVFEEPAAVWLLSSLGVLSAQRLRRGRRYAIVIQATIAAALPGGDPLSMILALLPLLVLYEISIFVAAIADRRREAAYAEAVGDT